MTAVLIGTMSLATAFVSTGLTQSDYAQLCEIEGEEYHVCPELLQAIIEARPLRDGTIGPMHLIASEQNFRMADVGVTDLHDPACNIAVGACYLYDLYEKYGDDNIRVLTKYFGGTEEDAQYMQAILNRSYQLEIQHGKVEMIVNSPEE